MKVLFLTNIPSPYRVSFFSELGMGCDLTVIYENVTSADRNKLWVGESNHSYREIFLQERREVLRYLDGDYDQIIIGMYSSPVARLAISYMRRKKISFGISTDGGFISFNESWLKYRIKKYYMRSASYWLSSGKTTDAYLLHYGASKEKIYHYPFTSIAERDILSVPTSAEEKKRLKKQLGLPNKRLVVGVGQFIPRKGFDVLICAAQQMKCEAEVYIIGGEKNKLEILLGESLPSNIHTISFLTREQLFLYYYAADLFVLPTREDVWGLVINEAMACGLPVITTDHCIAGLELVENGTNGFIVPVGNIQILAEKMDDILLCSEKIQCMGQNSLKKIHFYTYENMAKQHLRIFEELKRIEKTN